MIGYAQLAFPPSEDDRNAGREVGSPNRKQREFIELATKICVFVGGMGTGKTAVGAFRALVWLLSNPGGVLLARAPIYGQNRNQFNALMGFIERVKVRHGIDLVASAKSSPGGSEIVLQNGSRCVFHSAQSRTGIFGLNVGALWDDEIELYDEPEQTFHDGLTRLRQESDPTRGIVINSHLVLVTSTAQYLTGLLKDLLEDAKSQAAAYASGARSDPPMIGAVVCPSSRAIGYGLTQAVFDTWRQTMPPEMFLRAIMCVLQSPPEVIFGDHVAAATYPDGNVVDYVYQSENPTYLFVDWGINRPYFCLAQKVPSWDAIVIVDEWGPDGSSVGDTVRAMRDVLHRYKLVDANGFPTARRRFAVIGDPTTNPGMSTSAPSEDHVLALDGRAAVNRLRWTYSAPENPIQRSKRAQVQFIRALLKPRAMKPRLLFSRYLTDDKDRLNAHKQTRRGIWWSLREGYRFERDNRGTILDKPKKDGVSDHAFDALAYGLVVALSKDFWRLHDLESGLYTGAANW